MPKNLELSRGEIFMGSCSFHLTIIVKDIYRSKSGNMCSQIIIHSTTNYFIYLTMQKYKVLQTCWLQTCRSRLVGPDWSVYRDSTLRLNHMHRSLSFDFSFSPWVPLLSNVCVWLCKTDLQFASSIYRQSENCFCMGRLTHH